MRRIAGNPRAGFSLVEALVATVLMGLIMGALATLTAQWLPNWNRGLARVQRTEQVAVALDRLVTDLAAAEYVFPNRDVKRPLFDGAELGVTFVRSAIGPNSRGLDIVRIAETTDALGRVLVRTRAPFAPLPIGTASLEAVPFGDPVVLLRQPFRVAFAYAGVDGNWTNNWQGGELPSAVRIVVRDAVSERALAVSTATRVHVELPAPEPEPERGDADADGEQPGGGNVPAPRRRRP